MAGVQTIVRVDGVDEISAQLNALLRRGGDMKPAMEDIGAAMLLSTQRRFEEERGPDGQRWRLLAASTVLARIGGSKAFTRKGGLRKPAQRRLSGLAILRDSGRLYQSLTYQAGATEVRIGSGVIYAAIHQLGGQAGRGRRSTIPARPFLGADGADRRTIGAIVEDYLAAPIGGRR